MANRYYVNGTGLINDTFHWSLTSGGVGGASIPTSIDNIFFDNGSSAVSYIVTLNATFNCLDLNFTNTKTCTFTSSVYSANIYGSLTLWVGLTWNFTGTAYTNMRATDSRNITTNNIIPQFNFMYINGVNGIFILQSNLSLFGSDTLYLQNGTFDTNDKNINIAYLNGVVTSTMLAKSGNHVIYDYITSSNLNSGTSTITIRRVIGNSNVSFYNFKYTGLGTLFINITIINNLTLDGEGFIIRPRLASSSSVGTQRTITVDPTKVFASNCDFQDIKFTNPVDLSQITGGSQDFGNNTNITFTPGIDCYYKGTTGAHNWSANWKLADRVTAARVPLIQDNARFDNLSFTGVATVNLDIAATCKNIDFTGIDKGLTLSSAVNSLKIYGDTVLIPNLTWTFTGTAYTYMSGLGSFNITTNGIYITNQILFSRLNSTWILQDDLNIVNVPIELVNGTLNTNNKTLTCGNLHVTAGSNYLICGTSTINIMNLNTGLLQLGISANTATFNIRGTMFYIKEPLIVNTLNILGIDCYLGGAFIITASVLSKINGGTLTFDNPLIIETLLIKGVNSNINRLLFASRIIGTQYSVTTTNVVFENVDFRDIKGLGTANWNLSAIPGGSGDCGGNSNIIFTPSVTQYYKHTLSACNWSDAKWYSDITPRTTIGRVPLPQDDAIFDGNSFTGASTLTVNVPRLCRSLDMSGVNQNINLSANADIQVYGHCILTPLISMPGTSLVNLFGRGLFNLNTYDRPSAYILINIGTYTVLNNITLTYSFRNLGGTIDLNDFNLNTYYVSVANGTTYFGNGLIIITASNSAQSLQLGTNSFPEFSTFKIMIDGNVNPNTNATNLYKMWISGNNIGYYDFIYNCSIVELTIDPGRKVRFTAGTTTTIGKLTAIGTQVQPITIGSVTAAAHILNKIGPDVVEVEYCNISNSNTIPIDKWSAGETSIDGGNNSGWTFKFIPIVMWFFALFTKRM